MDLLVPLLAIAGVAVAAIVFGLATREKLANRSAGCGSCGKDCAARDQKDDCLEPLHRP